jgi:hypothetical protein
VLPDRSCRSCHWCGEAYAPRHGNQKRFCSADCREAWNRPLPIGQPGDLELIAGLMRHFKRRETVEAELRRRGML